MHFKINLDYKDVLPISGTVLQEGTFNLSACGNACVSDESCQTFFYKSLTEQCFLYNLSIWRYTKMKTENGTGIYNMHCMFFVFGLFFIFSNNFHILDINSVFNSLPRFVAIDSVLNSKTILADFKIFLLFLRQFLTIWIYKKNWCLRFYNCTPSVFWVHLRVISNLLITKSSTSFTKQFY